MLTPSERFSSPHAWMIRAIRSADNHLEATVSVQTSTGFFNDAFAAVRQQRPDLAGCVLVIDHCQLTH